MSKIAEKLSGFLQRRFVSKLVNFVFECALDAILLYFFLYWPSTKHWLHTNQNMLAIVFEMCPFLFWWKSNHSFLFCKLVVQAKIPRFPIWWKHFHFFLMKTLSLFFWWKHFHFFWWKHFHFFLTVHFSYTFFMVELSHFTSRGKLRFHVFFYRIPFHYGSILW